MPVEKWEVQGLQEVNATLTEHMQILREIPSEAKLIGESMNELTRVERQYRRGIVAIRTATRNQHAAWIETMRIGRRMQTIFRDFRQIFETYTMSQIRIERLTKDVTSATKDVGYWQDLYNQYVRDFGEESVYAQDAYEQLQKAMEDAEEAQKALNKANQDAKFLWVGVAEGVLTTTYNITGIALALLTLKAALAGTTIEVTALATAFAGLAAVTAIAIGAKYGLEAMHDAMKAGMTDREKLEYDLVTWKGATQGIQQQVDALRKSLEDLWRSAVGGSVFPDIVKWVQLTKTEMQGLAREAPRMSEFPTRRERPTVRSVSVSNYFSDIRGIEDYDKATIRAARRLIERLESAW